MMEILREDSSSMEIFLTSGAGLVSSVDIRGEYLEQLEQRGQCLCTLKLDYNGKQKVA